MEDKENTDMIELNSTNVKNFMNLEQTEEILNSMVKDPLILKDGYKLLQKEGVENRLKKLACSTLNIFLKRNWGDDNYILNEERLSIVNVLLSNIGVQDYFMKNYLAKLLGVIAAKEFPNCYEGFIKLILDNLSNATDPQQIDTLLRILTNVLNECDDRCAIISGEMLPVIMNVFKSSTENQKNREKCLKIISQLLNKLSYADGTDPDLISRNLDNNSMIEECLGLFTSILISNPKLLFDIKKYTIKILDILVRDMPIYSSKFFAQLIEPAWRLIVLELSLYTDNVVFNKKIVYEEEEEYKMEDENHVYTRGYESDEEDEKYGLEGLILELIDFSVDLLKRRNVINELRKALLTFLLCIKGYCLMTHNAMILWKNDPNLYITEEYDDENINSVRSKALNLVKEITKEIDDDSILKFLKIIISEFTQGVRLEDYEDVKKLDDYNFIPVYFEKLNTDPQYILKRHEANLLILGTLAEDLVLLRDKNKITNEEIENLIKFLFEVISNPSKDNNVLVGRALWTVSRLLSLVRYDNRIINEIFEGVSIALCHPNSDLSVCLVASQTLASICDKITEKDYFSDRIKPNFIKLIKLLELTNEDTVLIPIECINSLSKINNEESMFVAFNASKLIVEIYSKYYNDPEIGVKVLDLIKLWCKDKRSAKILINLFVPFAIFVFDDFFRGLGKENSAFEDIKKTVMTEHGNAAGMDVKGSLEMLPNLIDIITMLMKYCVETTDTENLRWIALIVNVLCEILIKSNDMQIIQRGTSFLRFYIPLCKNIIIQHKQQPKLFQVIMRFFDPALLESNLLYLGNVIAQYFTHIERKIDVKFLEAIVKRIYKAKMPSIVQSLVLFFSRFIIIAPKETLEFLTQIQVENKVGLKVLIDKWLLHQPLFRGIYFKNVSIKALTMLYEIKNNVVETLMVIGYDPSHSNASVEVNAPFKILSVLIRCLNNEYLQDKMKQEKNDYDHLGYDNDMNGDEDYEENERLENEQGEFNEENLNEENVNENKVDIGMDYFKNMEPEETKQIDSKLGFFNQAGKGGGLNNLETGSEVYLTDMLGFDYNDMDGDDDNNCEEDLIYLTDIEYNFVLKDFLYEWFVAFKLKDPEYLFECLKFMPKSDQEIFKNFNL